MLVVIWVSFYVGALAYTDDLALIAPGAYAMRHMLQVCDDFASQHSRCNIAAQYSPLFFKVLRSFEIQKGGTFPF